MNTEINKKISFREILKTISTIISWTVFVLLLICAALLLYYFIATRIYATKGSKYEPKFSLYTIISPSMVPNINVYDVIVDLRVDEPKEIEIGDVITFYSDSPELRGGTITHRVISIIRDENGNYSYQTKGDNNLIEDSSTVPFDKIVGKVAIRIPQLGRIQFFLASNFGWLLLILIPALYIIFKDVFKIIKLNKNETKKTKKLMLPWTKHKLLGYTNKENEIKDDYLKLNEEIKKDFFDIDDDEDFDELPKLK